MDDFLFLGIILTVPSKTATCDTGKNFKTEKSWQGFRDPDKKKPDFTTPFGSSKLCPYHQINKYKSLFVTNVYIWEWAAFGTL